MPASPLPGSKSPNLPWVFWLFTGLLILNACLVSPYIGWYDSGEMTGVTVCLGISHPSGQVLFHLFGKIFLLLPFGTPAFRLGLMSVFCSALASGLFFVLSCGLAQKVTDGKTSNVLRMWLLLLTLSWSFSMPWWRYSLMPLVYALHLLLGMLVLWTLSLEKPAKWALAFFILGMATVFRPTQFFALPFVGLFFLWEWGKRKEKQPKVLLFAFLCFGLGRSTALYLPLRSALHPEIAYGDLTHWFDLFHHVMAMRFSHFVGVVTVATVGSVLRQVLTHLWEDLTPLGVGLLVCGLWISLQSRKKIPVFLWIGMGWGILEALFVFTIPFPTFESHQVLLGWVYGGLLGTLPLVYLEKWSKKDPARSLAVGVVLVLFVVVQFVLIGHLLERKRERGAQDYARNILEIMDPNSVYYPTEENEYFPVVGYQQSFNFRKDVQVLEPGASPAIVGSKIKECLEQNHTLYVTRQWALPLDWAFRGAGPLLKVVSQSHNGMAEKIPPPVMAKVLWGKIVLVNARVSPDRVQPGGRIEITYQWSRLGPSPPDDTDSVVALFADDQGNYWMRNGVFWLHDIHEGPLGRSLMKPGFGYEEKRILFIPSDFPPGNYHLVVGLQKPVPSKQEGQEAYGKEFYERGGVQNLDKFLGRGEEKAVVQFAAAMADSLENGLWPVTKSAVKLMDTHFAPVADLRILAPGE